MINIYVATVAISRHNNQSLGGFTRVYPQMFLWHNMSSNLMKCSAVVAKANKLLGMICWLFEYTNAEMTRYLN